MRNGSGPRTNEIINILAAHVSPEEVNAFHQFNSTFQTRTRSPTNGKDKEDLISELARKFNQKGQHKADNVFMQHVPDLFATLNDLSKNKLSEEKYPYLEKPSARAYAQDVIVFFVGGTTFEEARVLHEFNRTMVGESDGRMRAILGGTDILSTRGFMDACRGNGHKNTELSDLL